MRSQPLATTWKARMTGGLWQCTQLLVKDLWKGSDAFQILFVNTTFLGQVVLTSLVSHVKAGPTLSHACRVDGWALVCVDKLRASKGCFVVWAYLRYARQAPLRWPQSCSHNKVGACRLFMSLSVGFWRSFPCEQESCTRSELVSIPFCCSHMTVLLIWLLPDHWNRLTLYTIAIPKQGNDDQVIADGDAFAWSTMRIQTPPTNVSWLVKPLFVRAWIVQAFNATFHGLTANLMNDVCGYWPGLLVTGAQRPCHSPLSSPNCGLSGSLNTPVRFPLQHL